MAIKDLKGWDGKNRRWQWMIRGERVGVTCVELHLTHDNWTKEGSIKAAYEWKTNFMGHQIVERAKQHPHSEQLEQLKERFQIQQSLLSDRSIRS